MVMTMMSFYLFDQGIELDSEHTSLFGYSLLLPTENLQMSIS